MEGVKKVVGEYDVSREREVNRTELVTTIPTRLRGLRGEFSHFQNLEEWHVNLLVKITISILSVCNDLLKTIDDDALPTAAWNARNLLELWVWTKYCGASRDNARRFYEDCLRDSQGLADSYFKLCDVAGLGRELEPIMRENIQSVAKKNLGVESIDASYEKVAKAAATVGLDNWYRPSNAFLSKFAHPTAFLVLGVMTQSEFRTDFQGGLTTQGVFFAHQCVTALEAIASETRPKG